MPMLFVTSCTTTDFELAVDVLSDLQMGLEVDRIEVRLDGVSVFDGLPERPLAVGARVGDLQVAGGDHELVGRAFFDGELVTERRVLVLVREDRALTIPLTRGCRGVRCDAVNTTCANSVCVDPQCSPETPEFCTPDTQCAADGECAPAGTCGDVECSRGTCLLVDDGRCGAGFFCAGADGCALAPVVVDAGAPDAPNFPDAAPDVPRTCPEPWGSLPVDSVAVVGAPIEDPALWDGFTTLSVTPASVILRPTMLIDMWVRLLEPEVRGDLLGNQGAEGGFGFSAMQFQGRSQVELSFQRQVIMSFDAPGLDDGCWHHVAFGIDAPTSSVFYIQDGSRASRPLDLPMPDPGEVGFLVGRDTSFPSRGRHIALHHLRFWNSALSDAELDVLRTSRAPTDDPRLIDEIPMQTTHSIDGVDILDSRGTLEAILGRFGDARGTSGGTLMSLDELESYAASL